MIVKPSKYEEAKQIFDGTNINITVEGRKYLGGFIGTNDGRKKYTTELVDRWKKQLLNLCDIARTEPHAAFNGFMTGFRNKLTYHKRVIPDMEEHVAVQDEIIDRVFIPTINGGHVCTPEERKLLSLPIKTWGMSIVSEFAAEQHRDSKLVCKQLSENIIKQERKYMVDKKLEKEVKKNVVSRKLARQKTQLQMIQNDLSAEEKKANDIAQMKGAGSWLAFVATIHDNTLMNKREFHDAVSLRYRWKPKYLPQVCECGKKFSIDHSMTCSTGGFIHARHDELKQVITNMLSAKTSQLNEFASS